MRTNLEYLETKKQITPQRTRLKLVKKVRTNLKYLEVKNNWSKNEARICKKSKNKFRTFQAKNPMLEQTRRLELVKKYEQIYNILRLTNK